jgi:hypothetical protein
MAVDPRFNFVVKCPQTSNKQQDNNSARKDFFNAVGKVGDIELLNRIGNGAVASGLRTLAKTSDAIRGGDVSSSIITNGVSGDATGANVVLAEVGINPQQAEEAGKFNPGVLNVATAEAENVYNKVKQGNYKLEDIPGSFQNLQNLSTLVSGIFTPGGETGQSKIELCGAKNYAQALIRYAPKHKFMFILQFTLKNEYNAWDEYLNQMAFVVKNTGRPNINVEHEEVNMYNFWTRVPKRTVYEPITMRFHDDSKNFGHSFFAAYLEAISPIARLGGYENDSAVMNYQYLENIGLNGSGRATNSSASVGALEGNNTAIIDELKVFHLFDYGRFMSVYNYKNPKILSMNLDDLDMSEGSTANEIEIQFAYDALHITPVLSVREEGETVRDISGRWIDAASYIDPVFQVGPSSSDEAGGLAEIPDTDEQSFVGKIKDAASGVVGDAQATANQFLDDAQQTYDKIYNGVNDAASSALDSFDSPGGGGDFFT